jgi:hypothetical protein
MRYRFLGICKTPFIHIKFSVANHHLQVFVIFSQKITPMIASAITGATAQQFTPTTSLLQRWDDRIEAAFAQPQFAPALAMLGQDHQGGW